MEFLFGEMDMERLAGRATVQATVEGALPLPGGRRSADTELMCYEGGVTVSRATASEGTVTVEGRVRAELICRGPAEENGGGELFSFASGAAFRYSAAVPGAKEGMPAQARARLVALELRQGVELTLEALLELECAAFEAKPMRTLAGVKGCPVEFAELPLSSLIEKDVGAGVVTLREELELPGTPGRILHARGACALREAAVNADCAALEGQLFINVLYQSETGPMSAAAQFPFQMETPLDDRPNGECFAVAEVEAVEARLLDGMDGVATVQARVGAVTRCYEARAASVPADAYLPGAAMASTRANAAFLRRGRSVSVRHAVSETIPLPEGLPAPAGAVCCSVRPLITAASATDGIACVEGILFLRGVCSTPAGELFTFPAEIPFLCETPCGDGFDRAWAEATCLSATLSVQNAAVTLHCALLVEAEPWLVVETPVVTGMEERELPPARKAMVLYYAAREETLFDVGKRFSLPREAIARANPDAREQLLEGQPLLFLAK